MSELVKPYISEEYLDMVPRPTKEERTAIKHSMMYEGQKDPIVMNEKGKILDGHTRFEICEELGLIPKTRIEQFKTLDEERRYVIESNTNRRQLNPFQKVELFYHVFTVYKKEAEDNHTNSSRAFKNHPLGGSLKRYASLIGVGEKRTHQATKLIENGTERIKENLRIGTITINLAYKQMTDVKKIKRKKRKTYYPKIRVLLRFLEDDSVEHDHILKLIKRYQESKVD